MWVAGEVEATVEKASQRAKIRPPAAAGLFYAGDPHRLQATVSELLGEVVPSANVLPKALIAPHAGYVYSGRVAAEAFATLRASAQSIARVVLIGPAHFVAVRGIAAPTVDGFETPLRCKVQSQFGWTHRHLELSRLSQYLLDLCGKRLPLFDDETS